MADYDHIFWKSAGFFSAIITYSTCNLISLYSAKLEQAAPQKHQIKIYQLIFPEFLSLKNLLSKAVDNASALVGLLKLSEH